MTTPHADRLIADYLRRLDTAAIALPPAPRTELLAEIREHIDEALREADATDETTVRNVLERLGSPEVIVAAADGATAVVASTAGRVRAGGLEIAALIALGVGGVIPVLGWLVGVILVAVSGAWSARDKAAGVLLGMLPVLVLFMILLAGPDNGGLGPLETTVMLGFGFVGGIPSALYLAWRLRRTPSERALGPVDPAPGQAIV